jgi:galactose mutarotase-like enzyme
MVTLCSDTLEVRINPLGAELTSLKSKDTGLEYLWEGDPKYWGKHSPVLFPIVGSLVQNTYYFEGQPYTLPRHGLARVLNFTVEKVDDAKAIFTLESDDQTLLVYPFPFRFQLSYAVFGNSLLCTYAVHNPAEKPLWFSVGGHPAFKVPLLPDTAYNDYYLQFNVEEPLQRWHLQDGLIGNQSSEVPATSGRVPLQHALFYDDAIVLTHLQSDMITLGCSKHNHGLNFYFEGFPHLGIWAAKDAPFVCIEPWCGHADTVGHNQQLIEKPGIEMLEGGAHWERTWKVEFY